MKTAVAARYTGSHKNTEVKQRRSWSALGWVTARGFSDHDGVFRRSDGTLNRGPVDMHTVHCMHVKPHLTLRKSRPLGR